MVMTEFLQRSAIPPQPIPATLSAGRQLIHIPYERGRKPPLFVGPSGGGKGLTRKHFQGLTPDQMNSVGLDPIGFGFPPTIASRDKREGERNVYRRTDYRTNAAYQFNKRLSKRTFMNGQFIAGNVLWNSVTQQYDYYALPIDYFVDLYGRQLQSVFETQAFTIDETVNRFRSVAGDLKPFVAGIIPLSESDIEIEEILYYRMTHQRNDDPAKAKSRAKLGVREVDAIRNSREVDVIATFDYDTAPNTVTARIFGAYLQSEFHVLPDSPFGPIDAIYAEQAASYFPVAIGSQTLVAS
jgi:hypothetical protein